MPQSFANEGHSGHHSNHEHHSSEAMEEMDSEMSHEMDSNEMDSHAGHHSHNTPMEVGEGVPVPSVQLMIAEDPVEGWNLEIQTTNFDFAPESVNQPHQDGEKSTNHDL